MIVTSLFAALFDGVIAIFLDVNVSVVEATFPAESMTSKVWVPPVNVE